ncbi:ATP-binding protein [Halocalculus aciditolerans]|uniref:Uncharacterized protein n=1 Tax=Halocalculus aciditolerans TaxID=1383812 RepID=A0A830FB87_9EURY|nr:ATP-binding protein [Halocalculus aciditolerans]GGL57913.1 hypothetical protein GCM10009039_15110 [Halocalculus aciditolerans]
MHLALASATGTGKSYTGQAVTEFNLRDDEDGFGDSDREYDGVVALDYCDEFRGLVKAGMAKHWLVGERELSWSAEQWATFLKRNPSVILAKHELSDEQWREVCDTVIAGIRLLDLDLLLVVDEAHTVAPQATKLLPNIRWLAQTGRKRGISAIWITQKLSEIDKVVISQATAWLMGGFKEENDLNKLSGVLDYDEDVHKLGGHSVPSIAGRDELLPADGEARSVRVHREGDQTVGMEFVFSDDEGTTARLNTQDWNPKAPHYAREGNKISIPGIE